MAHVRCTSAAKFNLQLSTVRQLCKDLDTPRSLAVDLLLANNEFEQYVELSTNPDHYDNAGAFADDYLVTEALRKSPYMPLPIDRKAVAQESFWISEIQCAYTNDRLDHSMPDFGFALRKQISRLLGVLSSSTLRKIEGSMRHGPGACFGFEANGSVASDKFDKTITTTIDLLPYYKALLGPVWHDHAKSVVDVVPGNRFTCVPKDAKTDRGICIEPMLNVFCQLGVGTYLKSRLAKFGADQSTQQFRNREFASRAQKDGLVTIDLSRASDTLSIGVVKHFFPEPWFELLNLFRSSRTLINDEWHELEKFSSMGNGFTFELETLVFLALARAIVPRSEYQDIAVFGDDIILPKKYAMEMIRCLDSLGFKVNTKKTFLEGRFFESCGTDWYDGINVRPFYLKEMHANAPPELQIANRLRLYAVQRGHPFGSASVFRPTWQRLSQALPRLWKTFRVPIEAGDTGLIVSFTEANPRRSTEVGWEGWHYRFAYAKPVYRRKQGLSVLLNSLSHGGTTDFSKNKEPVKGFLGGIVPKTAYVLRWPDGLDWV